jgi:arabinofuranan 3-O-arabinosyltransferase
VLLEFDGAAPQLVDLDDTSLRDTGQRIEVPIGSTFVRITIMSVAARPGGTDPGASAVGFAELGLGAHREVVIVPSDVTGVPDSTPLAISLTRLRTDPLNRWRSDPEPQLFRQFTLGSARDFDATVTIRRNARASDETLNRLAGVDAATSNRRLTGDPGSTAAHAVDGDIATAWTSPFSDVIGSTLNIPLDPIVPTSSLVLTQTVDEQHSTITAVTVTIDGVSTVVDVPAPDDTGRSRLVFPDATGNAMSLTIDDIAPRTTVDRRYAETTVLPVAIREIESPAIAAPRPATTPVECRTDLVEIDGQPLAVAVDAAAMTQLLEGTPVDVHPCPATTFHLAGGTHLISTAAGLTTGLDIDRIVLRSGEPPVAGTHPTVTTTRSRTTRTATVSDCPAGCWLILGEGLNDGWEATAGGTNLGAPRQISGGFNGWWLPGSTSPVTVKMTWAPQRTMWIGMILAALAVLACAVLIVIGMLRRDRVREPLPMPAAPVPYWPVEPVGRRRAWVAAVVLTALTFITISPTYAVLAAAVGVGIVILRRPQVAGVASIALVSGLGALIIRRQLRYRLVANPSWPAAFDDLHRLGLFVVVLLLVATILDECPTEEREQLT